MRTAPVLALLAPLPRLALLALVALLVPVRDALPAEPAPEAAAACLAAGDLDGAERILLDALRRGEFGAADAGLRRLVELKPGIGRYKYYLAFSLIQRYRLREAETLLVQAIGLEPRQHEWLHALTKVYLDEGKHAAAFEAIDRAIAIEPRAEYHLAKALCAWNAADLKLEERELRACLALKPDDAEALYRLGYLVATRGADAEALELLRHCLRVNPAQVDARFRLGVSLANTGELEAARAAFEEVLRAVPGHVGAAYRLGQVLVRLGRKEEGRRRLREFAALSRLQDEIEFRSSSVKLNPDSASPHIELAELLLKAGRDPEAEAELGAARAIDPRDPRTFRLLATLFDRQGRKEDAARARAFAAELGTRRP